MTQLFRFILGFTMAGGALFAVGETIPVDHREPIIVRVLNGRNGLPVPHLRLLLAAGYDEHDIDRRLWSEEASTNPAGEALVPRALVNFPYFEVSLKKAKPCSVPLVFNIGRIRHDGQSAPNHCGIISTAEQPGVLTIFSSQGTTAAEGTAAHQGPPQDRGSLPDAPGSPQAEDTIRLPNEIEALLAREPAAQKPGGRGAGSLVEPDHENSNQAKEHGHAPSLPVAPPASDPAPGTSESFDSYLEMCVPER
jgi:hypothetical protein